MGGEGVGRASHGEATSLRDYLRVVRRRKWVILQAVVLVPLAATLWAMQQDPVYVASAEVLVQQNIAQSLTGTNVSSGPPDRALETQARLAKVPEIGERTLAALKIKDMTVSEFQRAATVAVNKDTDILHFSVQHGDPKRAMLLASEYARQYTLYRSRLDTNSLARARGELKARIHQLDREGKRGTDLYTSLVDKEQQLATLEALQTSSVFVVRTAIEAFKVRPNPKRNALLGLVLGLVLGLGLAFVWEALDTRVRTTEEIGERLGLPLLARLPSPPRRLQTANRLVMLAQPNSSESEPYRVLRTNFEFFNLEQGARTVMVTSAVEQEGKSTTVANLAVALARGGQRVILVDLDLRRPILDRLFRLEGRPGFTDAALGRAVLDPIEGEVGGARGSLQVVTSGRVPHDVGEFVGSDELARTLAELRAQSDIVLIDAPPLLLVGDAMALSANVDALIVITRVNVVRREMLNELRRVLDACPATKLGFVVTAAESEDNFGAEYGYAYGYGHGVPRPRKGGTRA